MAAWSALILIGFGRRVLEAAAIFGFLAWAVVVDSGSARALELRLPITCTPGETCWVTSYVDVDPGPQASDHACGRLTYDGHKGTDIGLGAMDSEAEVAVLAAADGMVLRVRDSMPDINSRAGDAVDVSDRECGNGVVIDHGDGWETQYCHLRRGSVMVAPGDRVTAGAPLGLVGLSGLTEHPHLHVALRQEGRIVDPFTGRSAAEGCVEAGSPDGLWVPEVAAALAYQPLLLYNVGFAGAKPDRVQARAGTYADGRVAPDAPVLVLFVDMLGVAKDDRLRLSIQGPDGETFAESETVFEDKGWVQWFGFTGKRRKQGLWPRGAYQGRVMVERPGVGVIASRDVQGRVE